MKNTIDNIQYAVLHDIEFPDTVYIRQKDDLLLFNYRPKVQYDNMWTNLEIACRGLIINKNTAEIIARPFDKFFNWGENNKTTTSKIKNVTEKMDGSLGIHYRLKDKMMISTRGSFDSDQALWATEHLNKHHNIKDIPYNWTMLFEIIYPDNRIVIDYNKWSGLALLGIRDRFTASYIPYNILYDIANLYKFRLPKRYTFDTVDDIIGASKILPANQEGWVVEFKNGKRFKFKGDEYKKIHKLISGLSFKYALECHKSGIINKAKESIPDEFYGEFDGWVDTITNTITNITEHVNICYNTAPKTSRKEYAVWVKNTILV